MQLTPRDKRMLQVLGVVAGLGLIYLVFTTLLGGDDGGEIAAPTGPTGPAPTLTVTPTVTPSPTPRETLPPVVLAGARDPFSIPPGLSPSPSPGGGVGPTPTGPIVPTTTITPPVTPFPPVTTTPPTTTPPVTTPPTTTPPTTTPPTTTPPPGDEGPDDQIRIGGHDVRLVSIYNNKKKLQVEVDGTVYTVEVGARFDDNFKLVRIDGRCARFLFGDQSFTLCERRRK